MSKTQHPSLKAELLYLIGRATSPLSSADLYERCELADDVIKVSKALANLQADSKVVRVEGPGRARYKLADGVATPAPAGKAGRSKAVQQDDAAQAAAPIRPAADPGLPRLDIPAGGVAPTVPAEPRTMREKGRVEAAFQRAKKDTARELAPSDAALADAIIANLKRRLAPQLGGLATSVGVEPLAVHIHIDQVDIHLGGL